MRIRKSFFLPLIVLVLLCSLNIAVFAKEVPDTLQRGSIHIVMRYEGAAVCGGTLTLYQVGLIEEENGNYSFVPTEEFSGYGEDFSDILSGGLAAALSEYAGEQLIAGVKKSIDDEGSVNFEELEFGLYLLVQEEAAAGYSKAVPFLVSIPMQEEGAYRYDVDASPKVELAKEDLPPESSEPEEPTEPTEPEPPLSVLPQTGQLNWPVPILCLLGLSCFSFGWIMRLERKDGYKE